jgi:diamine N-acetyltransferase
MMEVAPAVLTLEPVTVENYAATLALSVKPEQKDLVAPVVHSLADAYVHRALPRVAREGADLVGFVLVYPFELDAVACVNVVRFLIDRQHQGRGLGRALMAATLSWLASWDRPPARIRIATLPHNAAARRLYQSAGFVEDGIHDGEVVMWRSAT